MKLNFNHMTLAFAIASFASAGVVHAETVSKTVSYADLDLTSPAGQKQLDRRIVAAGREICSITSSTGVAERWSALRCQTGAVHNGRAKARIVIAAAIRNDATEVASSH